MYEECLANYITKIDVELMSFASCINEYNYEIKTSLDEISPLVKRTINIDLTNVGLMMNCEN